MYELPANKALAAIQVDDHYKPCVGCDFDKMGDGWCALFECHGKRREDGKNVISKLVDYKMNLYHVTTPKKAKLYRETGFIQKPVRGFDTLTGAMAWAIKTGRTVIYFLSGEPAYKLPDHHNKFGTAWWIDENIPVDRIKCVRW